MYNQQLNDAASAEKNNKKIEKKKTANITTNFVPFSS